MPKLIKLKNKPFWIVTAIILLIGVTFYSHTYTEGFEDMYNWAGILYYGTLSDISGELTGFNTIMNASDGETVWKTGNSAPNSTDAALYMLLSMYPGNFSKDQFLELEKNIKTNKNNLNAKTVKGFVTLIIKDSSGEYVDIKGNKIIGSYIHFLGMTLLKTTLYWILGGVSVVILIIIIMYMRSSSSSARYNNGYR